MNESLEKLLVCYVPAMDLRRIDASSCPNMTELRASSAWTRLRTLPTTEHVPTMLTGTYPHQHERWGPKRTAVFRQRSVFQRMVDVLPDFVTTSAQGCYHMIAGPMDLALVPPRRRRQFEAWTRYKYIKHSRIDDVRLPINGLETVFTVIGPERSRYVYHGDYKRLPALLPEVANGDYILEIVEIHCLDKLQHWRLDKPDEIAGYYRGVDAVLAELHDKCSRNGITFMLLSDHGMEPVTGWIDVYAKLRALDVVSEDYALFVENAKTTVWFNSDFAREQILKLFDSMEHTKLITRADMASYGIRFEGSSFGDAWLYAECGYTFFPNDFHQPLAVLTLTAMDWQQRPRARDPRHKGDHGYLPENVSEQGFMMLANAHYMARADEARLIDFAPTILTLLGAALRTR